MHTQWYFRDVTSHTAAKANIAASSWARLNQCSYFVRQITYDLWIVKLLKCFVFLMCIGITWSLQSVRYLPCSMCVKRARGKMLRMPQYRTSCNCIIHSNACTLSVATSRVEGVFPWMPSQYAAGRNDCFKVCYSCWCEPRGLGGSVGCPSV